MGLPVDIPEPVDAVVGVYLGRCQAGMPQQFLHGIKVGAVAKEMGRKTVPEHMGAFFVDGGDRIQGVANQVIGIPGGQ